MLNSLIMKMIDPLMDDAMVKMMTEDYPDNPFIMASIAEKLSPRAMIEAWMRAESGIELQRPMGSPVVNSPWDQILLSPRQLFQLPTTDSQSIQTATVIGPYSKKPLHLEIPIMITGMSYGGSLSLQMKMALAKGATLAGTCTNTGESSVTNEERDNAQLLIGQYNRGGWLSDPEQLKRVDAIEVQLGQGAFGGAVDSTMKADTIGKHLAQTLHVDKGADATVYARMPNVNTTEEIINLINHLKASNDVPVGIKIAGSDFIEYELDVIAQTQADFIVIDGAEGGTAAAPPTLQDNLGLPTLYTLARAVRWLEANQVRNKFSLIAAGSLTTPGHFLKAIALGADAVYIGSIALIAAMQSQITKVMPQAPATQLALYVGKQNDQLDVDLAAKHLANFLKSCTSEMKLAVQALGKTAVKDLNPDDLVTTNTALAEFLGIRSAFEPRSDSFKEYFSRIDNQGARFNLQ